MQQAGPCPIVEVAQKGLPVHIVSPGLTDQRFFQRMIAANQELISRP